MKELLESYIYRYPQLSLPVKKGMSGSREYRDIVRRGMIPEHLENPFVGDSRDRILRLDTPVGLVEVLALGNRRDFQRFVQVMAYQCEPVAIRPAVGAMTFLGVNNWRKILAHREEYKKKGGQLWNLEFRRFTEKKENYQDTVCVVSWGPYSGIANEEDPHWPENSLSIRAWHEATHIVCRKLYPDERQAVWDEIVADMIGLLKTYQQYDTGLAQRFLGIQDRVLLPSGRLWHYVGQDEQGERQVKELVEYCIRTIGELEHFLEGRLGTMEAFEILANIFSAKAAK